MMAEALRDLPIQMTALDPAVDKDAAWIRSIPSLDVIYLDDLA